jgi:hypothetical protein
MGLDCKFRKFEGKGMLVEFKYWRTSNSRAFKLDFEIFAALQDFQSAISGGTVELGVRR